MLLYFAFAEIIGGFAGITGAYFAGLFHKRGDKRHYAEKVFSPFVNAILLPIFLGSIGMQIDVSILNTFEWGIVALLLVVAIISKLAGCWTATLLSNWFGGRDTHKWSLLEGYIFGSSMIARGEVGLVVATILQSAQVISPHQYVVAVVVIILSTIAAPIMLALGFHWLEIIPGKKRDEFTLNIGRFKVIGTRQMFNIIMGRIEASGSYKTSVRMSEGRTIASIEGQDVKIIYCPDESIIFKGDKERIKEIIHLVKGSIDHDVERLSVI